MVANKLAIASGINISEGKLMQFNNRHHTYLTRRFDRTQNGKRIHFASAMTFLGYTDGEGSAGASYLELVEFISRHGAAVEKDLENFWRRIVFCICIKNTDDHLRNHGLLLTEKGWVLSPAFDINPNEYGTGLSLNISETNNALCIDLAMEVAGYFRVFNKKAKDIIQQVSMAIKNWRKMAAGYKLSKAEQDKVSAAFEGNM